MTSHQQRRKKWRWTKQVTTSDKHKWNYHAITWQPAICPKHDARRTQARPRKRWIDDTTQFLATLRNTTHNHQLQQRPEPPTTDEMDEDVPINSNDEDIINIGREYCTMNITRVLPAAVAATSFPPHENGMWYVRQVDIWQ